MITIVMPVYNTGEVLNESIQSLLRQTYKKFEIICVDDKSTDKITKDILDKYEKLDNRIMVIHMPENIGPAQARNIGIDKAKGEYIVFLDADDVFEEDMLLCAYNAMKDKDVDMCVWGYRVFECVNNRYKVIYDVKMDCQCIDRNDRFSIQNISEEALVLLDNVPWNKMCRLSFINKHNIKFQSLKCANDVYYSIMCSIQAKKIVCVDKILLNYRCGLKQQISSNRDPRCACNAFEKIIDDLDLELYELNKSKLAYAFIQTIIHEMKSSSNSAWQEESYYLFLKIWEEHFAEVMFDDIKLNKLVRCIKGLRYKEGITFLKGDFYQQLLYYRDDIINCLESYRKIVVWGVGKRGKSCIKFLLNNGIEIFGVVDLSVEYADEDNNSRICQIHSEQAIKEADIIIATNANIYEDLSGLVNVKLFNLEKFCEFG